MASDAFLSWANRTVLRPGREEPYLSIQDIVVFVRDLEVSKRFYLQQLGFELITEQRSLPTGERWIEVAPPDGSANLALVEPKPDQPEYKLIGGYRWVGRQLLTWLCAPSSCRNSCHGRTGQPWWNRQRRC
jgi:hypothetical protein